MLKTDKEKAELLKEISGVDTKKCMKCGRCSASCPSYDAMDIRPHQFVSYVQNGDVEPLLQLRQTGTPLGLRGLLVAGVVISALGAVMDVAMSISSALTEVHTVAPDRDGRALFRSGMNIGRDMVGTMTNTLILAFLGSGLSFIIYLYSLGLDPRQLISSPYMATEVISGIASSIGVILAVPLTALITSFILVKDKKPKARCGSKPEDKKLPKEVQ